MWEVMMVSGTILGFTRKTGEGTILCMRAVRCYDCSASVDECVRSIGGTAPTGEEGMEVLGEEPAHCHFVHHKSHMHRSGIRPHSPQWEAGE